MGEIHTPRPVNLVIGILSADKGWAQQARETLQQRFGPIETELSPFPFTWTHYYADELGATPLRSFLSFETLIAREELVDIKHWTNAQELAWSHQRSDSTALQGRPVNLDPGILTLGQFFLATTKDQRQRVYIRDGIFVEPTLYFQGGHFHPFDWTYRDYQSPLYIEYLETVRQRYAYHCSTQCPWSQRAQKGELA